MLKDVAAPFRELALPKVQSLFEDTYLEDHTKNILVYYLRTAKYDKDKMEWLSLLDQVGDCNLEVDFTEPASQQQVIKYLPFRYQFDSAQLKSWIVGHRTTIIDIEALRLPAPSVYTIMKSVPNA